MHSEIASKLASSGNCLAILASGLGERALISALVEKFKQLASSNVAKLVVIVAASDTATGDAGFPFPHSVVTGETSSESRESSYVMGGVVVVTARVLLSDLLSVRLAPELIDLLIIPSAHDVSENSNEVFAVHLFREKNDRGALVAVSERPTAMSGVQLNQLVKNLFLSEVFLFPRFHEIVHKALDDSANSISQLEVHQLSCSQSVLQKQISTHLLSILRDCLDEIGRSKSLKDTSNELLTNYSAEELVRNKQLMHGFRRRLDPVWSKLSWRTKQIISDLSVIRQIFVALERYNCVSFLFFLESQQRASSKVSPWWFSESAQRIVRIARERVESLESPSKWREIEKFFGENFGISPDNLELSKRFRGDRVDQCFSDLKILVLTPNEQSCEEWSLFLSEGKNLSLLEFQKRYLLSKGGDSRREVQQLIDSTSAEDVLEGAGGDSRRRRCFTVVPQLDRPAELSLTISELLPHVIVLVEPSLSAVRSLEVWARGVSASCLHVVLLSYSEPESLGEQTLAQQVRRENACMDEFIRAKNLITFCAKGELKARAKREISTVVGSSTRSSARNRAKSVGQLLQQTVIIDSRELRSALPFALYKANLNIQTATLSVGDYILSRDISVERKSVTGNDLAQSLVSGRLYKQLVNMTHEYAWPVLLLEFSPGKSFQLSDSPEQGEINPASAIAQISALIMHFPSLKLVWSPSYSFTASIFGKLKQGREQPRILSQELNAGAAEASGRESSTSRTRAIELLKTIPGITASNLPIVLKSVSSLQDLVALSEERLVALLGKRDAWLFSRFVNQEFGN